MAEQRHDIPPTAMNKTKDIINKYLPEFNLVDKAASKLSETFGESIHDDIAGFIAYAESRNIKESDIQLTLAHDIGGALRDDTMMLPRVDGYAKYGNDHTVTDNTTK